MTAVWAAVPAAGRSSRIGGGPKPLLDTGDGTFLERVVRSLREGGIERIRVGVREEAGPVAALARRVGATPFVPDHVDDGPIATVRGTIRFGRSEGGVDALVVLPADFPLVRPTTVEALLAAWRAQATPLVVPAHAGRTGHPALFAGGLLDELLEPDLPEGARTVVERHGASRLEVAVDDPGIHIDIDTLPEYRRMFPGPYRKRFQKW